MKMDKELKKKDYKNIADCIISGQVPSADIACYFNDNKFYQWYKKHFIYYRNPLK